MPKSVCRARAGVGEWHREPGVPDESGQTPSAHVTQRGKGMSYLLKSVKCYTTLTSCK